MQYRRDYTQGASYFFTVVAFQRALLFSKPDAVAILRAAFYAEMVRRPFTIDAITVLVQY